MKDVLLSRDSKGKCRVIEISLEHNESENIYTIKRSSGLFDGKRTQQPNIVITAGKVKRTVFEQAILQYNSELKKYLDKGYKKVSDLGINELNEENIQKFLPAQNTDQKNVKKVMLCKVLDKTNKKLIDKQWLGSTKIDGTRCLLYWDSERNEVLTSSRGGGDYNIPATYIRQDPYIVSLFKNDPNLILDGELFIEGAFLSRISGLVRKETLEEDHKLLKFYCYDIVDEESPFKFRVAKLGVYKNRCPEDSKIVFIDHIPVKGLDDIMKLHDQFVAGGWEGLVIKDPEMPYKCGARDNRCLKVKEFTDDEYKILGLVEGLREEDMCFLMETSEGYQFKAKPIGTREDKQWYREHINELIGMMGTVKHFGMTNTATPVPNLPVMKAIRLEKDI